MKKNLIIFITLLLILSAGLSVDAQSGSRTIMFYVCGSYRESYSGSASDMFADMLGVDLKPGTNTVVQTGGTEIWDPEQKLSFSIPADRVTRWQLTPDGFAQVESLPQADMAAPETLSDFVRWSVQNYPAEKYILILWGPSNGAGEGLFFDENFEWHGMSAAELGSSLRGSGVIFETVVFDADYMASLETAVQTAASADYMLGTEGETGLRGANYRPWLQYLYDHPDAKPAIYGRKFCDMYQQGYADWRDTYSSYFLTCSFLDLRKVAKVNTAFDHVMHEIAALLPNVNDFSAIAAAIQTADHAGLYYDLIDFAKNLRGKGVSDDALNALMDTASDTIVYAQNGGRHLGFTGLGFYYGVQSNTDPELYAGSSYAPSYLALIDAIREDWQAPDQVYQQTEKLPDIDPEQYQILYQVRDDEDINAIFLDITNGLKAVATVSMILAEKTDDGRYIRLNENHSLYVDRNLGQFAIPLSYAGVLVDDSLPTAADLKESDNDQDYYEFPIRFTRETEEEQPIISIRFKYSDSESDENEDGMYIPDGDYEILGIQNNRYYASDNMKKLYVVIGNLFDGEEYTLMYPVITDMNDPLQEYGDPEYIASDPFVFDHYNTVISESSLFDGDYAGWFLIRDIFGNRILTPPFYFTIEYGDMVRFEG